jgi:hypothetical protein
VRRVRLELWENHAIHIASALLTSDQLALLLQKLVLIMIATEQSKQAKTKSHSKNGKGGKMYRF